MSKQQRLWFLMDLWLALEPLNFLFTLGTGFACSQPDLTVTAVSYDPMTGLASATIANTGELDVLGSIFCCGFLEMPDTRRNFPQLVLLSLQ